MAIDERIGGGHAAGAPQAHGAPDPVALFAAVEAPAAGAGLAPWLEYIARIHPLDIEMGLERIRAVAERLGILGEPRASYVIVAGTNGKGSTCTCLERVLLEHGLAVGCTLSPHLHRFNERIRIGGVEVEDAAIVAAFEAVEACRGTVSLTYFEFSALAALWIFHNARLDVAVLEVGLGGRLDAFNVVDSGIAIVTSIGIDHVEYLGDDLEGIGREKAGVMRSGQTVVLGRDLPVSVTSRAAELAGVVEALDQQVRCTRGARTWTLGLGSSEYPDLPLPALPVENCALACAAAAHLVKLEPARLAAALAAVRMPGRLESRVARGRRWVLDVAHNPHGAVFLARELARELGARETAGAGRVIAVYGALRDKDVAGVAAALAGVVSEWVLAPTHGPRGLGAAELRERAGLEHARLGTDVDEALAIAGSLAGPADVILVFGSFVVIERARLALER